MSPLDVSIRPSSGPTDLIKWLPEPQGVLAWLRSGDGIVGRGAAASLHPAGPDRFAEAQQWWEELTSHAVIDDPANIGVGPMALVSLAYADSSDESTVTVPEVLLGRRRGTQWITTVGGSPRTRGRSRFPPPRPMTAPSGIRYRPGRVSAADHRSAVEAATSRISAGLLDKVVLARDLVADSSTTLDQRWILARLTTLFPTCWVFAVAGLLGASPELLLRVGHDRFSMLVLAGTSWPEGDSPRPTTEALLASSKNRNEHTMAVESAIEALAPLSTHIRASPTPSVLQLPNLSHLATRIEGRLAPPSPAPLALLARLHPTAAVCGTPRDAAQQAIRDLEKMNRGGYLGPVGWLDAHGNAEFAIALRCAQVGTRSARLFAGGGIVAGSTPEQEDAEVEAKLDAFRAALDG